MDDRLDGRAVDLSDFVEAVDQRIDGNGLIDDTTGWDFGMGDSDPNPEYTTDLSGIDVGFHGTFCAGIAAAVKRSVCSRLDRLEADASSQQFR